MARIVGIDLPRNKKIEYALPYIYGIGKTLSSKILEKSGVNPDTRVNELSEEQLLAIRNEIGETISVEGELRGQNSRNVKRLMDIGSYRGLRHRKGFLPVVTILRTTQEPGKVRRKPLPGRKKL